MKEVFIMNIKVLAEGDCDIETINVLGDEYE